MATDPGLGLETEPLVAPTASARRSGAPRRFQLFARIGLAVFLVLLLAGLFAPLLGLADPLAIDTDNLRAPPSAEHWLGTDNVGRDVLSRLVHGARSAFAGVAIAMLTALAIGIPWGLASGYGGTVADEVLMRVGDAFLSFPALVLAIAVVSVLGPSLRNSMFAIGITFAPTIARLLRTSVLPLRQAEFVLVARSLGVGRARVAVRHVLPNAMAPILVQAFALASICLIVQAALGFIGLGVPPPEPSWGQDLANAYIYFTSNPFATLFPGLVIVLAAWSLSAIGDGVRDLLVR